MGTPFDPTNSLHNVILDESGTPVAQKFDEEANDGDGGWVVVTVDNDYVNVSGGKAGDAKEVTPSDTNDLTNGVCVGLHIGTAGDVAVTLKDMSDGTKIVLPNLAPGIAHSYEVKRVWETGTTAGDIVALY